MWLSPEFEEAQARIPCEGRKNQPGPEANLQRKEEPQHKDLLNG
jgi:hypothetical protein